MVSSETKLVEYYNTFCENVETILNLQLEDHKNLSDNTKCERVRNFYNLIINDIFLLFISCKIKTFSSKKEETYMLSNSLFTEDLSLKSLFSNKNDLEKVKLWISILNLYKNLEENRMELFNSESRQDRLDLLDKKLIDLNKELSKSVKKDFLNVDVNKTTNNMIDDIVGSFQDTLNGNGNPFDSIMKITSNITEKYQKDIENGDIEIDKIMDNLKDNLPNMSNLGDFMNDGQEKEEEKIIIDETFSTADVEVNPEKEKKENNNDNFNIGNMMKSMNNLPNLGDLGNMLNKISDVKSEDDLSNMKEEMNSFLANELNINPEELNKNIETLQNKMINNNLNEQNEDQQNQ